MIFRKNYSQPLDVSLIRSLPDYSCEDKIIGFFSPTESQWAASAVGFGGGKLWWAWMSPLRSISQFAVACGSCEHKPSWLSKLDVLGAHLTSSCLKNLGTRCEVQTTCFSERNLDLWVLSCLWVAMNGVMFIVKLCLSLYYPFWFGFFCVRSVCRKESLS